jgi:formate hydrogenlyase subunit 6/NADH:ubiquinone oxidoreductase subunit I
MLETIRKGVLKKGVVTDRYPYVPYMPYDGHLGMPMVDEAKCTSDKVCEQVCPTTAIRFAPGQLSIDLGLCIFCGECARRCPHQAIIMSKEFELASKRREGLVRFYVVQQ